MLARRYFLSIKTFSLLLDTSFLSNLIALFYKNSYLLSFKKESNLLIVIIIFFIIYSTVIKLTSSSSINSSSFTTSSSIVSIEFVSIDNLIRSIY